MSHKRHPAAPKRKHRATTGVKSSYSDEPAPCDGCPHAPVCATDLIACRTFVKWVNEDRLRARKQMCALRDTRPAADRLPTLDLNTVWSYDDQD